MECGGSAGLGVRFDGGRWFFQPRLRCRLRFPIPVALGRSRQAISTPPSARAASRSRRIGETTPRQSRSRPTASSSWRESRGATSWSRATTPMAPPTRRSAVTAARRPISAAVPTPARALPSRPTAGSWSLVRSWVPGAEYSDFGVARYNADGSPDTSFSGDGKQRPTSAISVPRPRRSRSRPTASPSSWGRRQQLVRRRPVHRRRRARHHVLGRRHAGDATHALATAVTTQPDGKLLVTGYGSVARYNGDGSLDTSFSRDGLQYVGIDSEHLAVQPDGRIVVGGSVFEYVGDRGQGPERLRARPPAAQRLARYVIQRRRLADDRLGGDDVIHRIVVQSNDKIVAFGETGRFALARYNADGSLDTSFSDDGVVTTRSAATAPPRRHHPAGREAGRRRLRHRRQRRHDARPLPR